MAVAWDLKAAPGPGGSPSTHAHPHEQLTYVLSGELLFFIGAESRRLQAGDMVAVPAPSQPHSIQLLSAKVSLLDAFTPLRQVHRKSRAPSKRLREGGAFFLPAARCFRAFRTWRRAWPSYPDSRTRSALGSSIKESGRLAGTFARIPANQCLPSPT